MEQLNTLGYAILLISIIISILSIRYTLRLRKYLEEFIYVSKKISNKEFHSRISSTAKGDLGELSRNFNEMIEIMDKTISDLDYSNLQKTSILKSISHGILAIDIDGNIMLINEEAKRMLKCDKGILVEGKNIKNVIKEEKLLEEINTFKGWKQNKTDELKINDDLVYKVSIDPIYLESIKHIIIGSIINIQDITEKVKLEHMRSDFVANVSHELKTPLTSISGFVETLRLNENIDVQTRNRFLSIIETESDRLKRLIDDILLLSFIENNEKIVYEGVSLYNVFLEVYEMTNYIAKSKNINLTYEFDDKSIVVFANRDYIKQVFLNLIDNAIKYTPDGGFVETSVYQNDENIFINIKDNGIGISKEDTSRVFERFYRVDKARSRDVGGTGLGLAIVKHIVKSLNGTIDIKSELNVGTEFIVSIPKKNFLN